MDTFLRLSVIVNCMESDEFFTKVIQKKYESQLHQVMEESFLQIVIRTAVL